MLDLRSGTMAEALARARHARAVVRAGSERALVVAQIEDDGPVLGRFSSEQGPRRQTGGPTWHLRPGVTFVHLSLAHPSVLLATPPDKILNRNVRPLLAALRKTGALAMYGGRDFLLVDGEIVGLLGWARGRAGEVVIEAAITTEDSVMLEIEAPEVALAHLGKRARVVHLPGLPEVLASAYAPNASSLALGDAVEDARALAEQALASLDVAIGRLALHRTAEGPRLFGDLFADDALDDLDLAALATMPVADRREAVRGCVVEGVRNWPEVLGVLLDAAR